MARTQLNVRVPQTTVNQIAALTEQGYESQAHVIIIAVNNLYREDINSMTTATTKFQFAGEMYGNPDFLAPRPELTEEEVLSDWENLRKCFDPDPGDLTLGEDADGPAFLDREGNTVYSAVNR